MGEIKHSKGTDSEHEVKLDPSIIYAVWKSGSAFTGCAAGFEVGTAFVGNGSPVKVTGKSAGGKKLGKASGKMIGNRYTGVFDIPEDVEPGDEITFEVELSKNGLSDTSNSIPVYPRPEVTNMQWSSKTATNGDILTLSADIKKVEKGTEALFLIYEHDSDGAHDKIAEVPVTIEGTKVEAKWEYEYHEDVDEIPTQDEMEKYGGNYNPPEYFFVIKIGDFEYGRGQESGLLTFEDWIEFKLIGATGNEKYVIHLPDGSTKKGSFDDEGKVSLEKTMPGRYYMEVEQDETQSSEETQSEGTQEAPGGAPGEGTQQQTSEGTTDGETQQQTTEGASGSETQQEAPGGAPGEGTHQRTSEGTSGGETQQQTTEGPSGGETQQEAPGGAPREGTQQRTPEGTTGGETQQQTTEGEPGDESQQEAPEEETGGEERRA